MIQLTIRVYNKHRLLWFHKIAIWVFFINRSRTAWSWWSRETLEGVDYLEVGKAAILFEEWDSLKDIGLLDFDDAEKHLKGSMVCKAAWA